ncbi:MAG: HD domain-containing protein [Candidatus Berkelbacteria bacterium]|nr:HD domain-containing protein [Candidatus Berkelbacteria bacterium]
MNKIIDRKSASNIEKAISFLIANINKSGRNSKPVILHSLQVAFYLLEQEYSEDIIIASILHDILEDSDVTEHELKSEFGDNIANLVKSVSYDQSIEDWDGKYKEMFKRVKSYGKDALILKCADIYFNSFYIKMATGIGFRKKLVGKIKCFLGLSAKEIKNEQIWKDLSKQYLVELKNIRN